MTCNHPKRFSGGCIPFTLQPKIIEMGLFCDWHAQSLLASTMPPCAAASLDLEALMVI